VLNTARQTGSATGVAISGSLIAALGLTTGVPAFMAVGAGGYLLGAGIALISVPHVRRSRRTLAEGRPGAA
jgi:DHA2 family methylenomycin A resistance protein-like MFS transporter